MPTSLRSRRYRQPSSDVMVSLVAFYLRQEWFALPIETVARVIPLGVVYGDPQGAGISLTRYQNREILVIDVGRLIFGAISDLERDNNSDWVTTRVTPTERYLVLIQTKDGELLGLPIDSPPSIQRVSQAAFSAIPDAYLRTGNIRCLSSKMVQVNDRPALFLLDAEQLAQQMSFIQSNLQKLN